MTLKRPAYHLVTGAAGVIGFELVRQLLALGDRVVAVDSFRKSGRADLAALARAHPGALEVVDLDLADANAFGKIQSVVRRPLDAIFHLAAIIGVRYVSEHPYETLAVNTRSTLNMLDYALKNECRAFVFASSSENYASGVDAGQVAVPTPEDVPLSIDQIENPRWSYAASKICGEAAVFGAARLGTLTPVVVRFHNVYGPRMGTTHVIPEMLARCKAKTDPFPIFGADQTRSFLYVDDAGRALVRILEAEFGKQGGVYNIGAPEETRIADLADIIFEATGFRPRLDLQPAPPGSVRRRAPDTAKLTKLGFAPTVGLREGVRACWSAMTAG
jgi:UDP-glucuronate decarboxylase